MRITWLVLDVSYLAYRAFYSTGDLQHRGTPTGVLFGLFRDLKVLERRFNTEHFVFCFDSGVPLRESIYPTYKSNHKTRGRLPGEELQLRDLKKQMDLLRTKYLKEMGYKNVFHQKGYEADDIIASVINNLRTREDAIIVSGDHDLFQLLGPGIVFYNPREGNITDESVFWNTYNIKPALWTMAKAIAGCRGDNVKGVTGVAEQTACRYLAKTLNHKTLTYQKIVDFLGSREYKRNLKLVSLPYPGLEQYQAEPHRPISNSDWNRVMKSLGMKSLLVESSEWRREALRPEGKHATS